MTTTVSTSQFGTLKRTKQRKDETQAVSNSDPEVWSKVKDFHEKLIDSKTIPNPSLYDSTNSSGSGSSSSGGSRSLGSSAASAEPFPRRADAVDSKDTAPTPPPQAAVIRENGYTTQDIDDLFGGGSASK